ncbi:BatD family protein [Novipirellula artificiosorum]|uniref:Protein BatD n=1 Tax=Novipirellula artificiosorum TaxID=2528016 RepID=A0A5C6D7E0_9BACT|nr:BatD family protein [Novipirellula artificiosorum]TWU31754.1 hypothetical protein Poly41_59890 [Novipirellula artificiosorum]
MKYVGFVLLCWALGSLYAVAADVDVVASVDRNAVRILEPIVLTLRIDAAADAQVDFSALDSTLGPFEVVSTTSHWSIPLANSQRRWLQTLTLETMETGTLTIPEIEIRYQIGKGEHKVDGSTRTQPISIQVDSVLNGDEDLEDYRPMKSEIPIDPASRTPSRLFWVVFAVGLIAMVGCATWLWMRRRPKSPTAYESALHRLDNLRAAVESHDVDARQAYIQVASIAHDFAAREHGHRSETMTTDEVLAAIGSGQWMRPEQRAELARLLHHADSLRFANQDDRDGFDLQYRTAGQFVRDLVQSTLERSRRAEETP